MRYVVEKTDDKFEAAKALAAAQEQGGSTRERARSVAAVEQGERQRSGNGERLWSIPGVKKRIGIGWLVYIANAAGYWSLTVFLTTFMVEKFGASSSEATEYAIMFYVAQFFFAYIGTGLSD